MMQYFISVCLLFVGISVNAQHYTPAQVFAHNDYVREKPFYTAYELGVGYIEADVFLQDGELMVAHHENEIEKGRTLEELYLKPLAEQLKKNNGLAYPDRQRTLTVMIDLKTEGVSTLNAIVNRLKRYPQLTSCPTLQFMISGSVPDPVRWKEYPVFIYFDGRPSIAYNKEQLQRISMFSTGFRQHSDWDGRSELTRQDMERMLNLVEDAHRRGKKFRFWATPDFPEAWKVLMELNMDVIVTDNVQGLVDLLKQQDN